MTPARDPLDAIIGYNRRFVGDGRDPAWLRLKLERLCASPFGFLRGTFHLFVEDWPRCGDDPLAPGPEQPIVGDLHLENFGAFRAADGSVVFDVNDFDETAAATPAIDLARLATSIVLADDKHGDARAVERIGALLDAWLSAVRSAAHGPIAGKETAPIVRALIDEASEASRSRWLERRVEGEAGQRRFKTSEKYQRVTDERLRAGILDGVHALGARGLDVAVRVAGTGSLGRLRWAVLCAGKSDKPGKERILELKEALPSSLAPSGSADDAAARVIASQKQLQGAPPAFLGVARVGGRAFTVRELTPTEAKLDAAALKGGDLDALAAACGTVLGRLHGRGGALAARVDGRERSFGRRVAAFALRYAAVVVEDHARLVGGRAAVAAALGLPGEKA